MLQVTKNIFIQYYVAILISGEAGCGLILDVSKTIHNIFAFFPPGILIQDNM